MSINSKKNELSKDVLEKLEVSRTFEIYVEEYDDDFNNGAGGWKPVRNDPSLGGNGGNPTITVKSKNDLEDKRLIYTQSGQRFKILREINPPSKEQLYDLAVKQGLISGEPEKNAESDSGRNSDLDVEKQSESKNENEVEAENEPKNESGERSVAKEQELDVRERPEKNATIVKPPKYYKVGGIDIKDDNGRLYQKQWMQLSQSEASNIRLVNDKNNMIVNTSGKHFEMKKWVLIENSENSEDS